ncbi:hypothetical protein V2P57_03075 [Mycoplasma mycoides subsp. mycoides]|uniref:TRANSPOSASE FOR INSERTION SEQUENCE ELEMENT IS1138 n=1 Tax=Mycoplasma mycoides subsp. mycoides TaxID=2103 RepID=A0AAE2EII4_MYCMY|nr:transposase [Mycoplasma mycoides]ADK69903.1 conserved hypothetical protein [Mycoplasma mycoides subsp. mycoides SC str. Gladysdale]AIZ55461.1 Transposase, IS30 family [Mycoplasma mycoides subsp. mycoides]AME11818.1 hypothetical protein MmmBen50_0635 [Mycoplasma mycoides subsp. mycoides]AME12848.1 hypothetical protein MmmBen181_0690 [Mycoplasma mycoides subsp. mycoides]AME13871.1 hypothetical protein MmmBen326_0656 [Mycoplasma mycoides subsp. mycoides]
MVRRVFKKGFDFNTITNDELNKVVEQINKMPRKIFNWKSAQEVFETLTNSL